MLKRRTTNVRPLEGEREGEPGFVPVGPKEFDHRKQRGSEVLLTVRLHDGSKILLPPSRLKRR